MVSIQPTPLPASDNTKIPQ